MNANTPPPSDSPTVLGIEPALPPTLRRWKWLTSPIGVEPAAALRIAVGVVLLFDIVVLYLPNIRTLYGAGGFGDPNVTAPVFAPPSWRWSLLRLFPPTWGPLFLGSVWAIAALALLVGYRPRIAALVAWMLAVSFTYSNLYIHNGGDQLKLILLLMLIFLPSDGRWAIRRHPLARTATGPVLIHPWPIRLLMIQLAIMYFMNGYYKALGPAWRDGSVMYYVANNPSWAHFSPDFLPLPEFLLRLLAWITVVWELAFPLLMLITWARKTTLWIGVFFHLGTLVHLEVGLFPLYALCYYVPFIPFRESKR
jgi:hypothetical protein